MVPQPTGEVPEWCSFSQISTQVAAASAIAPPEPPSPTTAAIMGTPSDRHASVERAIASAWPRSSASTPGKAPAVSTKVITGRSEEHTSELQSLMRISYAAFCLKKKNKPVNETLTRKLTRL